MPNWVVNKINLMGNNKENSEILNFIKGKEGYGNIDFNAIIPMPDYIYTGDLGIEEHRKYGKNNWYDWSIENWGCKWNASMSCSFAGGVVFETPWDSPIPVFKKLTELFPKVDMEMTYADEDMGRNIGKVTYINGVFTINRYDAYQDGSLAWDIYIDLWGENECLKKDENGNWQLQDCEY